MEITETSVNRNLEELYKRSLNGEKTPLSATVEAAEKSAESRVLTEYGKAVKENRVLTNEEKTEIAKNASEEAHSSALKSLKEKTGESVKTSFMDVIMTFLEKAWSAIESVGLIITGNWKEGIASLKNGGSRAFSEIGAAISDWKPFSQDHGLLDTIDKHEKLHKLEVVVAKDMGISDPEERKKVVAQLAGEAPLPVQVSGGATVTGDQSPPPGGKPSVNATRK